MSKYTTTIHKLIDNNFDFQLNEYPIFDEAYRETLNHKILDYYFEDEIGMETPALFRKFLKNKMSIIMPKYNMLYQIERDKIDNIVNNINTTEELERKTDSTTSSTGKSNTSGNTKGTNIYQDTPQGQLDKTDIDNQTWATNLTQSKADSTTTANDSSNTEGYGNERYIKTVVGRSGNKYLYEIYAGISKNMGSVDQMVIDELHDLFMGIF